MSDASQSWRDLKELVADALERPAAERERFLLGRCTDPEQLATARAMLVDADELGGFLEPPTTLTRAIGDRIGPYEITGEIGRGGMGEVYRALDTRLNRTVAIKVLPAAAAGDPRRRERFAREARAIGALNHPHICTLHDVLAEDSGICLVMEHLEGEPLSARLQRGALRFDEALRFAIEIADALGAAHQLGLVHRDLKPGNVMLTASGAVLLDFGLARTDAAIVTSGGSPPLTAEGSFAGTLRYMAPEQLEGQDIDTRADIWAFGALLYEMLTGRRAFDGRSDASVIGAIMSATADHSHPLPGMPPALERLVAGCLTASPDRRWQSIRDVGRQLEAIAAGETAVPARRPLAWLALAAVLSGVAVGGALFAAGGRRGSPPPLVRFEIPAPPGGSMQGVTDTMVYFAAAPDGDSIAFVATVAGRRGIWIRSLDSQAARFVEGTENARTVFWSPDGRALGFGVNGMLKRVRVEGGSAQTLCATRGTNSNGTWSRDGTILFDQWGGPLMQVSQEGGTPRPVREAADHQYGWPQFLPDGRHYLFVDVTKPSIATERGHAVAVGTLGSAETVPLAGLRSRVEYAAGHLLFWKDGTLLAQPFDLQALRLTGAAAPLVDHVEGFAITGWSGFSVAGDRLLALHTGAPNDRVAWFDRTGRELEAVGPMGDLLSVRLSPDGSMAAFGLRDLVSGTAGIGLHDLRRSLTTRMFTGPGTANAPIWSPDGRSIVYGADRLGPPHLHTREVANVGVERQVAPPSPAGPQAPTSMSSDGRLVLFTNTRAETSFDVDVVPFDGSAPPRALIHTAARESNAVLSPDGQWLAYLSDESGRLEAYVGPFDDPQRRWQVSRHGATRPRWRRDGRELTYVEGDSLMSVEIASGARFDAAAPRLLFTRTGIIDYDVTADGSRFIVILADPAGAVPPLSVALNWRLLLSPR